MKINTGKIELILAKQGITANELSSRAGVSRQSISTIKAKGSCTPLTAGKIAAGLGVPIETIISKENNTKE